MAEMSQVEGHHAREAAASVVRTLAGAGHTAYFAGGCVRDQIMGLDPKDYDVATDAEPERIRSLFPKARYVGEAFGVVMVNVRQCWIEVATFRAEAGYSDKRRPDSLRFTDAKEDALRRDFTINGLFYDPLTDKVIDYVGGRADIERRVIRAIGDAEQRFGEDYLRMLRAVRFAARFEFALDAATEGAIRKHAHDLAAISRERIGIELRFMLEHASRARAVGLLQSLTLDGPALDEATMNVPLRVTGALRGSAPFALALAAWSLDRHHPTPQGKEVVAAYREEMKKSKRHALVRRWRDAIVMSNEERDALLAVLGLLPVALEWVELTKARRKRLMAEHHWPLTERLLGAVVEAMGGGGEAAGADAGFDLPRFHAEAAGLLEEGVAPEPLVTGDDLIAAGMEPGPAFKAILDRVYDAQLEGELRTKEEAMAMAQGRREGE